MRITRGEDVLDALVLLAEHPLVVRVPALTSRTTPFMSANARRALGRFTGRLISIALATVWAW